MSVRQIPNWDWTQILTLQTILASIVGIGRGLISMSAAKVIISIFFAPIHSAILSFVFSGFFYYTFLFFFRSEVEFRRVYQIVFLGSIPTLILSAVTDLFPPLILLGFAFSGVLLTIAFVDNFRLDKKPVVRLLLGTYFVFLVFWIWNAISLYKPHRPNLNQEIKGFESLQKEFSE